MRSFIFLVTIFMCLQAVAQENKCPYVGFTPVAISKLEEKRDCLLCIDSTGKISNVCALCLLPMHIEFYRVCYSVDSSTLLIIGRTDLPSVGIYLSNRLNEVPLDSALSESTNVTGIGNNDGFFEVIVKLKPDSYLFFVFGPQVFVARYRIGDLYNYLKDH